MYGALRKALSMGCEEIVYEFETEGWAGKFKMADIRPNYKHYGILIQILTQTITLLYL